jgi:hypothetical protein
MIVITIMAINSRTERAMCQDNANQDAADGWTMDDLSRGERALLGALRGWKAADSAGGLSAVLHAVKGAGLPLGAVLPLASLLGVLDAAGRPTAPRARCPGCRKINRDEAEMLDAVAAAQWNDGALLQTIVAGWLPHAAASAAAVAQKLAELAAALGDAEAVFPGGRAFPSYDYAVAAE